jgi:peptide/nickel transport system permease protein
LKVWTVLAVLAGLYLLGLSSGYELLTDVAPERAGSWPDTTHWLGCDRLGRDVFWRLVLGVQAFFLPGLVCGGAVAGLGAFFGALMQSRLGGLVYFGSGVLTSIPRFVLALLIVSLFSRSIGNQAGIMLAGVLAEAPILADAVAARIAALKAREFVVALEVHGVSPLKILLYHLLWVNARALILRHALAAFGGVLILESALSYLGGYGVAEPVPSWGNMVAFELGNSNVFAWAAPAVAIWLGALATWTVGQEQA